MITRADFIGFRIYGGPGRGAGHDTYKASDWGKEWTVTEEGAFLVFRGPGQLFKVPIARCVVHYEPETELPKRVGRAPRALGEVA